MSLYFLTLPNEKISFCAFFHTHIRKFRSRIIYKLISGSRNECESQSYFYVKVIIFIFIRKKATLNLLKINVYKRKVEKHGSSFKSFFIFFDIEENGMKIFTMDLKIIQSKLVYTLKSKTESKVFVPELINSL